MRSQKYSEQHDKDGDHDGRANELRQRELPTHEHDNDNAEFKDEVGGRQFERHGRCEVCTLAKIERASATAA